MATLGATIALPVKAGKPQKAGNLKFCSIIDGANGCLCEYVLVKDAGEIVRAVNAFDNLVAALKSVLADYDGAKCRLNGGHSHAFLRGDRYGCCTVCGDEVLV